MMRHLPLLLLLCLSGVACGGDEATDRETDNSRGDDDDDDGSDDDDDDKEQPPKRDGGTPAKPIDGSAGRRDGSMEGRIDASRGRDGATAGDPPSARDATAGDATGSGMDASAEPKYIGLPAGFEPFETDGEPLSAPDKTWTYIEFPDTQCRDGSPAGIAVSLNSASKKLMIYLEGGGACFDAQTCLANPANTSPFRGEKTAGLFNRSNAKNPVRDWNFVYVPYCTGDTHGGANPNATVPGVGPQKFVGYLNMQKFLNRIVPTFKEVDDILLTGISAGGFGAAQNAVLVQRAFPNVRGKVIDDSGPPLSKESVPECLQKQWRELWGLEQTFLKDCGANCPNKDDYAQDYGLFLAKTFTDRPSGLIEAAQDSIIAGFFGIGSNNCTGLLLLTPVPGPRFQADLLAYRDKVKQYESFSTFIPAGTQHTWLGDDSLYTGKAGDKLLVDWVSDIVAGKNPGHAGF